MSKPSRHNCGEKSAPVTTQAMSRPPKGDASATLVAPARGQTTGDNCACALRTILTVQSSEPGRNMAELGQFGHSRPKSTKGRHRPRLRRGLPIFFEIKLRWIRTYQSKSNRSRIRAKPQCVRARPKVHQANRSTHISDDDARKVAASKSAESCSNETSVCVSVNIVVSQWCCNTERSCALPRRPARAPTLWALRERLRRAHRPFASLACAGATRPSKPNSEPRGRAE